MGLSLVNGIPNDQLNIADRALNYGDGLFETIALVNGKPIFWLAHMRRMRAGASRLNIPFDDALVGAFYNDLLSLTEQSKSSHQVAKFILTRGLSLRGYKASSNPALNRIVIISEKPNFQELQKEGITVTVCKTQLARQPLLAGIKHLNRLEQVLARNEWDDPDITEGIVCDTNNHVIEGCMSNIFWLKDNVIFTPDLSCSGVDGIVRQTLINLCYTKMSELRLDGLGDDNEGFYISDVVVADFTLANVLNADEVFVCNSVFDILPVTRIVGSEIVIDNGQVCFPMGQLTQKMQLVLNELYLEDVSC